MAALEWLKQRCKIIKRERGVGANKRTTSDKGQYGDTKLSGKISILDSVCAMTAQSFEPEC